LTQNYVLDPMVSIYECKSISQHAGDVTVLVGFRDYYIRLETTAANADYILETKPLFGP